jgi:hypothetical protein
VPTLDFQFPIAGLAAEEKSPSLRTRIDGLRSEGTVYLLSEAFETS